jgi:vacuolar iron transporter family protein
MFNIKKRLGFGNYISWLRPAILGANDGVISIASMLVIMIVGEVSADLIFLAGMATLVAGSMAMATGEYVSVSSQSDAVESENITNNLKDNYADEYTKLVDFYVERGLKENTASEVATKLIEHKNHEVHIKDPRKIEVTFIKPLQAAITSATSYILGGTMPLLMAIIMPHKFLLPVVIASSLFTLGGLGALGAKIGNVRIVKPIIRIIILGTISLSISIIVGLSF